MAGWVSTGVLSPTRIFHEKTIDSAHFSCTLKVMKEIQLSQGLVAIVDNEDYEWLSRWKWSASKRSSGGYNAVRVENKRTYKMHREIMGLKHGDPLQVDHIEPSATLDNRRSNLRVATGQQNRCNRRAYIKSGFKGVTRCGSRWQAKITTGGKTHYLGSYLTPEAAHGAFCEAAKKHYGEFARA